MTYEEWMYPAKASFLKEHGWIPLWSEDYWVEREYYYTRPNWSGLSTDLAYQLQIRRLYTDLPLLFPKHVWDSTRI